MGKVFQQLTIALSYSNILPMEFPIFRSHESVIRREMRRCEERKSIADAQTSAMSRVGMLSLDRCPKTGRVETIQNGFFSHAWGGIDHDKKMSPRGTFESVTGITAKEIPVETVIVDRKEDRKLARLIEEARFLTHDVCDIQYKAGVTQSRLN